MDARADAGYNLVATNTDTTLILTADVPGAVFSATVTGANATAAKNTVTFAPASGARPRCRAVDVSLERRLVAGLGFVL